MEAGDIDAFAAAADKHLVALRCALVIASDASKLSGLARSMPDKANFVATLSSAADYFEECAHLVASVERDFLDACADR